MKRRILIIYALFALCGDPVRGGSCPELADAPLGPASKPLSGTPVALIEGNTPGHAILVQTLYSPTQWWGNVNAYNFDADRGEIEATPIWTAAEKLDELNWDSGRVIATHNGDKGIGFRYDLLNDAQKSVLTGSSPDEPGARDRLDYIRGQRRHELSRGGPYRDRVHILGDIVHSRPVHHGGAVFVGANDGMLHAFNLSDGQEIFAYLPGLVFKNLPALWDPGYSHRYYVDGTPRVKSIDTRTLLVGGLGKGGRGWFCLDISRPATIAETGETADWVLWEYPGRGSSSADRATTGFSFGEVSIVNSRAGWVVIVGNGYGSPAGTAALLVLDAATGAVKARIDTGADGCNGLSTPTPVDVNRDGLVDYVFGGDLQGNLWKFDLTHSSAGNWEVAYSEEAVLQPLLRATDSDGAPQPITSAPTVISHCLSQLPGFMVIFGTGKYLGPTDTSNQSVQTIYGIWDYGDDGDDSEYLGTFKRKEGDRLSNQPLSVTLLKQEEMYYGSVDGTGPGETVRVLSDHPVAWAGSPDRDGKPNPSSLRQNHAGWYFDPN